MIRIGVTGGIGSGKSTVCRLLEGLGAPVYYSDARAREIVDGAPAHAPLRRRITNLLGTEAWHGNGLDRAYVASKVFSDKLLLSSLNAIIHPAVALDFEAWALLYADRPYVVMESAVLFESGFDRLVDRVVAVSAPAELRVERVVARGGGMARADVERRMANQLTDADREARAWLTVHNDGDVEELARRVGWIDGRIRALAADHPGGEEGIAAFNNLIDK
jgi:dephospho-CoA kinase